MTRPSPRTGSTGAGIQKFGTQQLKYLDTSKPALGVIEIDTGAITRLGFSGETSGTAKTPFSQKYQEQRSATIRTFAELETSPHAPTKGFGTIEFPDLGLGDLFGNGKENGEDCGWFGEKCWFKGLPDLSWLKWVLLAVGIGVLLWLLRPLFGVAKNITGVSKSAVTRVNGIK